MEKLKSASWRKPLLVSFVSNSNCRLCFYIDNGVLRFFMDIAFYGTNLNQALILSSMGFAPTDLGAWDTLFKQALGNLILAGLGSFPGYIMSVLTIERLGRKRIQLMGFLMVGALYIVLGAGWEPIQDASVALFIVIFAISQVCYYIFVDHTLAVKLIFYAVLF